MEYKDKRELNADIFYKGIPEKKISKATGIPLPRVRYVLNQPLSPETHAEYLTIAEYVSTQRKRLYTYIRDILLLPWIFVFDHFEIIVKIFLTVWCGIGLLYLAYRILQVLYLLIG